MKGGKEEIGRIRKRGSRINTKQQSKKDKGNTLKEAHFTIRIYEKLK